MKAVIAAIVVIYNKSVSESLTCNLIKAIDDDTMIYVVDNSDEPNDNESICNKRGMRYLSMKGNKGISKAYNAALDMIGDADVIVFLDDDTEVTEDYFIELRRAVGEAPDVDIFVPVVRGQDGVIYSPNEFHFLKNRFPQNADQEITQGKFNAIASCMAVRLRVFDGYRFNEKLFVDQVDQFFFCEQRKLGRKFIKLNVEILQNFYQRGNTLSAEAGWKRLRCRIIDIYRHARLMGGLKYLILAFIKCCGLGVQIGKKCKSISIAFKAVILSVMLVFRDK